MVPLTTCQEVNSSENFEESDHAFDIGAGIAAANPTLPPVKSARLEIILSEEVFESGM